jgi:hypothetical protein
MAAAAASASFFPSTVRRARRRRGAFVALTPRLNLDLLFFEGCFVFWVRAKITG